jgi:hypothetical protein
MTESTITNSPKFRGLDWQAQWLFFTALREGPRPCGIIDVYPKRYAQLSPGIDEQFIITQAKALESAGVMLRDAETDEMMFPGYLTEVTAPKNARKVIAVVNSLRDVASAKLRAVAMQELRDLHDATPDAPVWNDQRVVAAFMEGE